MKTSGAMGGWKPSPEETAIPSAHNLPALREVTNVLPVRMLASEARTRAQMALSAALWHAQQAMGGPSPRVTVDGARGVVRLWDAVRAMAPVLAEPMRATSAQEMARAIQADYPVVLGLPWREGMETADIHGVVTWTGRRLGRHAVAVIGYDPERGFRLVNAWGVRWASAGRAWLSADDVQAVLDAGGEAAVIRPGMADVQAHG